MEKNKKIIAVIVVLFLVILGLVAYVVVNKTNEKEKVEEKVLDKSKITEEDLVGEYYWEKTIENELGKESKLKIKLVLNKDKSATYEVSNGTDAESTSGSFTYNKGKIIYTDQNNKITSFIVKDKDTLQNRYNNNNAKLKKQ